MTTNPTVTIRFSATVPIMDYGNFAAEIVWQGEATQKEAKEILNTLRLDVAAQVLHVATAQIERNIARGKLAQVQDVDKYLLNESKPYYWLRTVAPEVAIPAYDNFVKGKPNTATTRRADEADQTCSLCSRVLDVQGNCTNKECPESIYFVPPARPLPPPIPLDDVNAQLENLMKGKMPAPLTGAGVPPPMPPATPKGNSRLNKPKQTRIPTQSSKVNKESKAHAN